MIKILTFCVVVCLFWQGILSAGELTPAQKTNVKEIPVPTQKITPTQKTTVTERPVPTQKGTGQALSDVPVPNELLDALKRLQPKTGEPGKNLGRAIARCVVKKKIANFVQNNLPSLPPLP